MIGYYLTLDETELADLVALAKKRGEEGIDDELSLLIADEDRCIEIDKAWHGIHVLLCGSLEGGEAPLSDLVLGGTALNDIEMAYLPVRYLDRGRVGAVNAAVADVDLSARTDEFKDLVLGNAEVYPGLSEEEDLNYLDFNFEQLKRFFAQAARAGLCMLLFIG